MNDSFVTITSSEDDRLEHPSILLLGADSKTGIEVLHRLAAHPKRPLIHAFVDEDGFKFADEDRELCTSVIEGSVRHACDIEEALDESGANWVVLVIGDNIDDSPIDRLTLKRAAKNIVTALDHLSYSKSVRTLAVSRIGADYGSPHKKARLGLRGTLRQLRRRSALADFKVQEENLSPIRHRTTVVRTTTLRDSLSTSSLTSTSSSSSSSSSPSSRRLILSDTDKMPSFFTERSDLAECIVEEILEQPTSYGSRVVNMTSVKVKV